MENWIADEARVQPAVVVDQTDICFDSGFYTAFPHVVRLEDSELLLAFRQAPREEAVRHTHMRSIITVVRSYDSGHTWELPSATQLAAGGGQEFAPLYLGDGRTVGALAWHHVVPRAESRRSGIPHPNQHEYPYATPGTYWAESGNYGLTWPPHQVRLLGAASMPSAAPILLADGRILCPAYSWQPGTDVMNAVAFLSPDKGDTWTQPVVMAQGSRSVGRFCEPAVIETEPGVLLALHRVEAGPKEMAGCFRANRSTDGGFTWSEPLNTGIASGACPRLLRLRDGRLVLTYGRRSEPYGIRARLSTDGGRTWGDHALLLRPGRNWDLGYTSSVQLDDGNILTVTYMQNEQGVTGIVGTFWRVPD